MAQYMEIPLIHSLLDNDLYKFTMMQFAFHRFPSSEVEYRLFYRNPDVHIDKKIIDQLQKEIDKIAALKFEKEEIQFLKGLNFFTADFLKHLETFSLQKKSIYLETCNTFNLIIKGSWPETILWEVILLALISELHFELIFPTSHYWHKGKENLKNKVNYLKNQSAKIRFIEFGTRRRFSKKWQRELNAYLRQELPEQFIGTSNVKLAMDLRLKCHGTMGHELLQAGQRISPHLELFQPFMLDLWFKEYQSSLSIALTDVLSLPAFLHDFQGSLAQKYVGLRIDSGNPFELGEQIVRFYQEQGIDPLGKTIIFSDALNFVTAVELANYFQNRIQVAFGIGTYLTNDHGVPPLNLVIKMTAFNKKSVGKLTDTPEKSYCLEPSFLTKLQQLDAQKKYESKKTGFI